MIHRRVVRLQEERQYHTVYGFPMPLVFYSPWISTLCVGPPAKVRPYIRFFAPEKNKEGYPHAASPMTALSSPHPHLHSFSFC